MSVASHLQKYPHARPSTIRGLAKQDQTTAQLRREVQAKRRREFIAKVKSVLMMWRG